MCRFFGYIGPRAELHGLVYGPPYGLERQAWAPRQQAYGNVNADGWGIGWYDLAIRPQPARYRTVRPMWADSNFANMAALLFSDCVVAAVRDASPGMPVDESSTAPFTADHYLFAHNGLIDGFRTGAGTKLRRQLSPERDAGIVGGADSEVAFALVLDRLDAGDALPDAVRSAIAAIRAVTGGRFNFVVSDGAAIVASRAGDSLYVWSAEAPDGPATLVASEPLDDEGDWIAVPDEHLVVATRTTVPDLRPLDP